MKSITNWREATVFDIESDNLLKDATLFHVVSFDMIKDELKSSIKGDNHDGIKRFFQYHIDKGVPLVCHNAISFDIPLVEKLLGMDLSKLMVIDTLYLSWYLNVNRKSHGLDSFFDDYGVAKPPISDWQGLTYQQYRYRCQEDVAINRALWDDFMTRLENMATMAMEAINDGSVGGKRMSEEEVTYLDQFVGCTDVDEYIDRILTFLMFKADMARLRERTKFKLNIPFVEEKVAELSEKITDAKDTLELVMPPVPKYTTRKKPKKPYLKDGKTLSAHGKSWNAQMKQLKDKMVDEFGNPLVKAIEGDGAQIKVYKGTVPPNAGSNSQLKTWLFSHGWSPQTFKFENDEPAILAWRESGFHGKKPEQRRIPQISRDGDTGKELCPSVKLLAEKVPEVLCYEKYTTIKHRLDTMKGFLDHCDEDGYIECRVGGLTNCMTADALILTDSGHIPIVDVCIGDRVLTHKGTYGTVTDSINNGVKEVYRITLESGQEIKCTGEHRVRSGNSWVYAKDVEVGLVVNTYGTVELWRDIPEFLGCKVSSWGRVMGPRGRLYKSRRRSSADIRCNVTLPIKGTRGKTFLVSRLVMSAFIGDSDLHVLHKDGNPNNNNIANLKYGTDADNWEDTKLHGTHLRATRARKGGKLDYTKVGEIRSRKAAGETYKKIAEDYGISQSYVSTIVNDRRWESARTGENQYVEVFTSDTVKSVEVLTPVPTFDLTISGGHSYVANGVVCHNTMREKHRNVVNLPGVDKYFGEEIRGSLIAGEGMILLGSDLSSLEDRTKHHYMIPHDAAYVQTMMADDYDPHILVALSAGLITQLQFDLFMKGTKPDEVKQARKGGKATNYASTYGAHPPTIARSAGVPLEVGKKLFDGYWKLNWSIKTIVEEQYLFTCNKGLKWLVNPINGMCYNVRKDSDIFSTLNQGTGSFVFDMWIDTITTKMYDKWGRVSLSLLMHDEGVWCFKDTPNIRAEMEKIVLDSIDEVNVKYKLRRKMGCDCQFGGDYGKIH